MAKCDVCGKEFTAEELRRLGKTAGRHYGVLHCPDCTREWNELVVGFEVLYLRHKLYGEPMPSIDDYCTTKADVITKLKVPELLVKYHILHRCLTIYERRV